MENVPIQMCIYHQKAIIRRYITDRPRTRCGQDLKELMESLCKTEYHQNFIDNFYHLKDKHQFLLNKRNENGDYVHTHLRAVFKSLEDNLPYIFAYTDSETLNIPPIINHLEGLFSHLKERINIHRGLTLNRKKKTIKFLLENLGK